MATASEDLDRRVAAKVDAARNLNFVHRAEHWEREVEEQRRKARMCVDNKIAHTTYINNAEAAEGRARRERRFWVLQTLDAVRDLVFSDTPSPEEYDATKRTLDDFREVRAYLEKSF